MTERSVRKFQFIKLWLGNSAICGLDEMGTSPMAWDWPNVASEHEAALSKTSGMSRMSGQSTRGRQGFASMDDERRREIASKGGKSVPNQERSFSKDHELAAEAGRKGGQSVAPEDRSFSRDPNLASESGRKGGEASHGGHEPRD
jgi:uncharacterized protein